MKDLVIDRKKWVRGDKGGETGLLNEGGNMCCLGFGALQCGGFSSGDIEGEGGPGCLSRRWTKFSCRRGGELYNTILSENLVLVNDTETISEEHREKQITSLFKQADINVTFIN